MAKKKATRKKAVDSDPLPQEIGTKLRKLIVKNLGCIGDTPVEIDLDDIVVLVGKNNSGKSTILRAYEVLFSSSKPKLKLEDFPQSRVDSNYLPTIELHTRITEAVPTAMPGQRWVDSVTGEQIVKERWVFNAAEVEATRQGFDVEQDKWSEQVPWGAANVANARRPQPHRIDAFASPEKQISEVVKILMAVLSSAVKSRPLTEEDEQGNERPTDYGQLSIER